MMQNDVRMRLSMVCVREEPHTHARCTQLDDRQNMRKRLTLENIEVRGKKVTHRAFREAQSRTA